MTNETILSVCRRAGLATGRTSQQMLAAEPRALYIWPSNNLYYPRELALHLGRSDLRIVALSSLRDDRLYGETIPVVLDHAAYAPRGLSWSHYHRTLLSINYVNNRIKDRREALKS